MNASNTQRIATLALRILTLEQAAAYLQVSPRTCAELARSGVIGRKVGREWRFLRDQLDQYVAQATVKDTECRSTSVQIPNTGKLNSKSLESELDARLRLETGKPHRSLNNHSVRMSGVRSS